MDPRQELIDKILEYKRFKEASIQMVEMETIRMQMMKRGNVQRELAYIGEQSGEGTEIQNITLYKLMKAFEKVMQKVHDRHNAPVHTVVRYNFTMEETREFVLNVARKHKTVSFEKVFEKCEDKIHALFLFLSMLELIQLHYMTIMIGEGKNNFIVEWNDNREETEDPFAIKLTQSPNFQLLLI